MPITKLRAVSLATALALALAACAAPTDEATDEVAPTEVADESPEAAESPPATEADATDDPTRESSLTVEELIGDPDTYIGEETFVIGDVGEELVEEQAFTIPTVDGSDELLVLNLRNVVFQKVEPGDVVSVQGTLVEFSAEALEEAGAELTPDDAGLADYDGEHVLVADMVEQQVD